MPADSAVDMAAPRKALLVGSSFSAAPMFFALKKHGLHVSVCGNLPADPCHQYADQSCFIDYSKPELLREVVREGGYDYIVPTCNDYSYMSSAAVADGGGYFGIDSLEVAAILHTKHVFREVAGRLGLSVPRHRIQAAKGPLDSGDLAFPLLVKPVDSFGGRGVTRVATAAELPAAVEEARRASRSGAALLEEFVDGTLHSHSAFIQKGRVALDFFVDEFCSVYPWQVDCSNHPSVLGEAVRRNVRAEINRLVSALSLVDGLLHTQFIVNGDRFWLIEPMRRCPGDLYGHLISRSTGIDYADLYVRAYIDRPLPDDAPVNPPRWFARHTISRPAPSVVFSFDHAIPARSVEVVPLKCSGERLEVAPFDKLGILFAEFDEQETMLGVTPRLAEHVHIRAHGT